MTSPTVLPKNSPLILLTLLVLLIPAHGFSRVYHELQVVLFPEENRFAAKDKVSLLEEEPSNRTREILFHLHKDLGPRLLDPDEEKGLKQEDPETYTFSLPGNRNSFTLEYGGVIHHPLREVGEEHARGQRQTAGTISSDGVYLSPESCWYPRMETEEMLTFHLAVELPGKWDAVSQGTRTLHLKEADRTIVQWKCDKPQNEIWLVAGRYTEYASKAGSSVGMVFLRKREPELAEEYLDATARYICMYETLIGPYPYAKFALVENFWETGYGMPSFTLMGPRVMRFPFILHSSYPHEILHNWWGNSVYLDPSSGNWGEGLTAYLSDHLVKEQRGLGSEYRQETLQKYADYVVTGRDLPLAQFKSRHGSVSEAVGYGKSLMFFHMLRLQLGDETFIRCLRELYKEYQYKTAGFTELRRVFEKTSGLDLGEEFHQWVCRQGAPELKVAGVSVAGEGRGSTLKVYLEQVQPDPAFLLRLPLAVTLEGQEMAYQTSVPMSSKSEEIELALPARPVRLDIDPEYDVFRRLDRKEIPPALTQAFGADKALIILPAGADKDMRRAYSDLAAFISRTGPGSVRITEDIRETDLPENSSPWIFGWENLLLPHVKNSLSVYSLSWDDASVVFEGTRTPKKGHTFVFTARHPKNPELAILWLASDLPEALSGLGRKLPHYHKYSYLVFQGDGPDNVAKGRWPVVDSPMTLFFPDREGKRPAVKMASLQPRKALASLPPTLCKNGVIFACEKGPLDLPKRNLPLSRKAISLSGGLAFPLGQQTPIFTLP